MLDTVSPPAEFLYRIGYGVDPFELKPWDLAEEDGTFGNRFDDPGKFYGINEDQRFRVLYCGTKKIGSMGEVTARFRLNTRAIERLKTEVEDDEPLDDQIIRPVITADWRSKRRIGKVQLDSSLKFVDFGSAKTAEHLNFALATKLSQIKLNAIEILKKQLEIIRGLEKEETLEELRKISPLLGTLSTEDINFSTLLSPIRRITQEASRYIYEQVDDSGQPLYAGIRYISRLNPSWECWAIYDRTPYTPFPIYESIFQNDQDLAEVARLFKLSIEIQDGKYLSFED